MWYNFPEILEKLNIDAGAFGNCDPAFPSSIVRKYIGAIRDFMPLPCLQGYSIEIVW